MLTDPLSCYFDPSFGAPSRSVYIRHENHMPQPDAWLRSHASRDEEVADQSNGTTVYGMSSGRITEPYANFLAIAHQEEWSVQPEPPSQQQSSFNSSRETPFEDAYETVQDNALLTPGYDAESFRSYYTATGDLDMPNLSPTSGGEQRPRSIDVTDHSLDIDTFRCKGCNIDLWDAFEHR